MKVSQILTIYPIYPILTDGFKIPLRNIIIGRALYATVAEKISQEICDTQTVCITMFNINPTDPMQFVYFGAFIIAANHLYKKYNTNNPDKKLESFSEYNKGRQLAQGLFIIMIVLFTKNVERAF